jgi:hypothetical protein
VTNITATNATYDNGYNSTTQRDTNWMPGVTASSKRPLISDATIPTGGGSGTVTPDTFGMVFAASINGSENPGSYKGTVVITATYGP